MKRFALFTAACLLLCGGTALAEGTQNIGANYNLYNTTKIGVDVITAGEVINISVGNDTYNGYATIAVTVLDPNGKHVSGSPFSVGRNVLGGRGYLYKAGYLPPSTITKPLRVVSAVPGTHTVQFKTALTWVDPFDITVTPTTTTPVKPASPALPGRVWSYRWSFNNSSYTTKNNSRFYVLTPVTTTTDFTWLLKFNGMAGFAFDLSASDIGLPAPNYGFSEKMSLSSAPTDVYPVYFNLPAKALGGAKAPNAMPNVRH